MSRFRTISSPSAKHVPVAKPFTHEAAPVGTLKSANNALCHELNERGAGPHISIRVGDDSTDHLSFDALDDKSTNSNPTDFISPLQSLAPAGISDQATDHLIHTVISGLRKGGAMRAAENCLGEVKSPDGKMLKPEWSEIKILIDRLDDGFRVRVNRPGFCGGSNS